MGVVRLQEIWHAEIEEVQRALLSCAGIRGGKEDAVPGDWKATAGGNNDAVYGEKVVCVTGGVSFLGVAVVSRLLNSGYDVRLLVANEVEREKVREMELWRDTRVANRHVSVVMAELGDVQSLSEAFEGCRGVFHTAAFVDPAGVSGYSKAMADVEVKTTASVMEACGRSSSVRNCVLTSSLLACIWRDKSRPDLSSKLWYALGKVRAEKAAWRIAAERGFNLVTVCPGLITGPDLSLRNPTATIAYLKGVREMYADGLLATVDVNRLAEAHVRVFEAMNKAAFGRYICFDRVIRREEEAEKLTEEAGIPTTVRTVGNSPFPFELSDIKLSGLVFSAVRCKEC
ncbi:Cinnamoyl-CoA reductase [Bertholletia excelsa]